MQNQIYCKECGIKSNEFDKFCKSCGFEFNIKILEEDSKISDEENPLTIDDVDEFILASRSKRLIAKIIDFVLLFIAILIPALTVQIILGGGEPVLAALIGAIVFAIYQYYLLSTISQTLGKKYMNIIIVKKDRSSGGFVTNVVLREWIIGIIGLFPLIGWLVKIVDMLFIFRNDRRCIHDMIANTMVIINNNTNERNDLK
tara:strand:+ start:226 stop:828 length:603 start_codon:yes stop_codon:yes gene_type:complete